MTRLPASCPGTTIAAHDRRPDQRPWPTHPPRAARPPHVIASPHGERMDPFYWLRDDERREPEVLAYLSAENAYKERQLAAVKPLQDRLYAEIIARLKQDDATFLTARTATGTTRASSPARSTRSLRAAKPPSMRPRRSFWTATSAPPGPRRGTRVTISSALSRYRPTRDWLAFCEDTVGRRQYELRFKDLAAARSSATRSRMSKSDVAWANDNETVLYVEKDPETLLGLYVKKHRLRQDPQLDALVFDPNGQELLHRCRQVQVGALHLHPHGEHGLLGVVVCRCR